MLPGVFSLSPCTVASSGGAGLVVVVNADGFVGKSNLWKGFFQIV